MRASDSRVTLAGGNDLSAGQLGSRGVIEAARRHEEVVISSPKVGEKEQVEESAKRGWVLSSNYFWRPQTSNQNVSKPFHMELPNDARCPP